MSPSRAQSGSLKSDPTDAGREESRFLRDSERGPPSCLPASRAKGGTRHAVESQNFPRQCQKHH